MYALLFARPYWWKWCRFQTLLHISLQRQGSISSGRDRVQFPACLHSMSGYSKLRLGTIKMTSECQFGMEQRLYLGHLVGSGTVRPESSKVEAITRFTTPQTKREVRTFLHGSCWLLPKVYSRFCHNCSTFDRLDPKECTKPGQLESDM